MEEKSFRVLLDLSEINLGDSEVKYVWMFVSPRELKTIFDFKRAINKKIPFIQENYKLFLRDGLLLEDEKISILREEDTIKLKLENAESSFQESFSSLNQIATDIHQDNPISCISCCSKGPKKRKSDVFTISGKESSSLHKQKKKKRDKSPKPTSLENENAVDMSLTSNCIPNLSYVSEPRKENHKSNPSSKKKIDRVTSDGEHLVKRNSKSKAFRNDNLSCAPTYLLESEKSTFNELDPSVTRSPEINGKICFENEVSQREQKVECDSNFKTFSNDTSLPLPYPAIDKSPDVCESGLGITKISSQDVSLENESPQTETNLKQNKHKKRKRRRKRKQKEPIATSESIEHATSVLSDINFKTFDNTTEKRKHIIYESPISSPQNVETFTLDPDSIICSELQETSYSQQSFSKGDTGPSELDRYVARFVEENKCEESVLVNQQNNSSNTADMSLKISTPYPKKILKGQPWGITPLSGNSFFQSASNTFTVKGNSLEKETTFTSYNEYPSLNCLPLVGTRLAFKTLELNEKYCPEVTDYKEGVVKSIDPNTDELTIELIQEEVKLGRTGKFENLKEDELPPNEIIKTVILSWSSLISPKQIS